MKKILVVTSCLISLSLNAQTADEVIQKYNTVMGGLDAFNKITSAIMTGYFSTQGNDLPLTIQIINGKAMRSDVNAMGQSITSSYFNGAAWKINPFGGAPTATDVSGSELIDFKLQSSLANQLMDYKSKGHAVELTGTENVEGIKVFKIKLTNKDDNRVTNYFISSVDYTMIKSSTTREIMGQEMEIEVYYSELKTVGPVRFYMERRSIMDGQMIQSIKIDKIELDVPIDEKIFKKPG